MNGGQQNLVEAPQTFVVITMTDVFLSYCRRDADFVIKLKQDMEQLGYTVWMDNDRIDGGDQWEKEIEASLAQSRLFLVVVSKDSNESNWVRRETIRAEQLKKPRIPVLLNDELPLRLLDLQYVDFRGSYGGGFCDLFPLLEKHLGKKNAQTHVVEEADKLMGAALRAFLEGDRETADEKAKQVIKLHPGLAQSPAEFWNRIGRRCIEEYPALAAGRASSSPQKTQAEICHVHVQVVEHSKPSEQQQSEGSSQQFVYWTLHLAAPPHVLETIDRVTYHLDPTFTPPSQVVRDRSSGFLLYREGWGTFLVEVEALCQDGTTAKFFHRLTFAEAWGKRLSQRDINDMEL